VAAALGRGWRIDMIGQGPSCCVRVCGLVIDADVPLAGLRPLEVPEAPDVRVRMRGSSGTPPESDASNVWFVSPYRDDRNVPLLTIRTIGSGYLLSYGEGARFLVSASGSEVDAWWDAPLTAADAADYLLGSVLAFIVRLRGMVPLHASAVVIDDCALVFCGDAGAGKSSIAAAFATLGYPVLSDDIVVIDDSSGCALAYPSHARVSMWLDSANSLMSTKPLPAHSPVYEKRRLDLLEHGYRFQEGPVPVGRICVLGTRVSSDRVPAARELRPQAALMKLVSQTYVNYLLDASMRAREFDVLGRVAASIPVSELSFGASLDGLVSECRLLVDRLALQSAAQAT
jgi:hypothetical protein